MSNIQKLFATKKAFIGYLVAGQRGLQFTKQAALALVAGGVDILEIGVPFSDPVADGPVIQAAMQDVVAAGVNIDMVLEMIKDIKMCTDVPIVLFTYYNSLLNGSKQDVYETARVAGVDAMLVVDLPLEEADEHFVACATNNIEPICVISPSTPISRLKAIQEKAQGFLYYACRNSTTGIKASLPDDFQEKVKTIKRHSKFPVAAGFGIANKATAAAALSCADAWVVGSLFIKAIESQASTQELTNLAKTIDPR